MSLSQPGSSSTGKAKEKVPEPGKIFPYKPLDASKGEIRLIELVMDENDNNVCCEVITTTVNNAPAYEALSYTWGSQECKVPILLNGQPLDITPNLHVALTHLRQMFTLKHNKLHVATGDRRRLWIDAVCINQQDVDERNSQIRFMWSIYANAAQVLVWLGEEADNSAVGMEMVRALDLHFECRNQRMIRRIQATMDRGDSEREMEPKEGLGSGAGESCKEARLSASEEPHKLEILEAAAHTISSEIRPDPKASTSAAASTEPRGESNTTSPKEAGGHLEQSSGQIHMFLMTKRPVITTQAVPPMLTRPQRRQSWTPGNVASEPEYSSNDIPTNNDPEARGLHYMGPLLSEEEIANAPLTMLLSVHGNTWGSHQDPDEWVAFQKLMKRPWWHRVWVIQEIAAAKGQIWVGCGSSWLRWEAFLGAALTIEHYKDHPFFQRLGHLGKDTKWILDKSNLRIRGDGRMDNWGGLLNILCITEPYAATDPRDKVFALRGFTPSLSIKPDYRKAVEEVYEDLVRESIRASRSLMMIFCCRKPKRLHLPSWVPDFSISLPQDAFNDNCPMGFFGADGNNWHTMGWPSAGCQLNPEDKSGELRVAGFVYDKPLVVGSTWKADRKERHWKFFKIITEYTTLLDDTDSTHFPHLAGSHRKECFWRTLIWNAAKDRYPAPAKFGTYLAGLMGSSNMLVDRSRAAHRVEETERIVPDGEAQQYHQALVTHGLNRRFFITAKGHLASGPAEMEMGDLIGIVLGSKTPLVLRQVEHQPRYELVGHAYVHGIMHGEALGALDLEAKHGLDKIRTLGFRELCLI